MIFAIHCLKSSVIVNNLLALLFIQDLNNKRKSIYEFLTFLRAIQVTYIKIKTFLHSSPERSFYTLQLLLILKFISMIIV